MDIHVSGSGVEGYLIKNNDDLVVVKNARSMNNGVGYRILDDNVEITGSPEITGNSQGVVIDGDNVILRTNKVLAKRAPVSWPPATTSSSAMSR